MQFIEVIDNALPEAFCDALVAKFQGHPGVHQGRTGGGVDTSKKQSLDITLDRFEDWQAEKQQILANTFGHIQNYFDKHFMALIGAVSPTVYDPDSGQPVTVTPDNYARVGRPNLQALVNHIYRCGYINLQKYDKGQGGYPHWHSEAYPQGPHAEPLHRVLLWMYYLNDVDEGGETEFFYQQHRVKPKKGRMVIAPAGFTHTHRGNRPVSGDKYILTSWVLFNRAEQLYGQPK